MSNKQVHLQMIQAIVTRMANNSFLIKGWNILLVSAILAVAIKDDQIKFLPVAFFPALVLWGLDGYFLWQERLFRKLYDKVTIVDEGNIDFSMNIASVMDQVDAWYCVALSKTLTAFHGSIVASIIVIGAIDWFY